MQPWTHQQQQCAHEFLGFLVETLTEVPEDYNRSGVMERPSMSRENQKALEDLLGLTSTRTTECTEQGCTAEKSVRITREKPGISTAITGEGRDSVNDCIQKDMEIEFETVYCEECQTETLKQKSAVFSELKKVVPIQLKRFEVIDGRGRKIKKRVKVNEVLTAGPFNGYQLTGAVLHQSGDSDTLESGHYTHIVRDVQTGKLHKTTDGSFEEKGDRELWEELHKNAYILFYSPPGEYPAPMKKQRIPQRDVSRTAQGRPQQRGRRASGRQRPRPMQQQRHSFSSSEGPFNFKMQSGQPDFPVKIPEVPRTTTLLPPQLITPSYQQLQAKLGIDAETEDVICHRDDLALALRQHFGYNAFKSKAQMDATVAILEGRDALVMLPTGGGKSLTYQLAGMMRRGQFGIVISPTVSLAEDQVKALQRKNIPVKLISQEDSNTVDIENDLKEEDPELKFLYCTPERLQLPGFRNFLTRVSERIAFFAVDEAHTLADWSNFRGTMPMIGNIREIAPDANWVALTATATQEVRDEIKATLGMENPETFETPIRRRNIYCEVVYKEDLSDEQEHLYKFLREKVTADGSGIVYVRKKQDADALCQYLQAKQMRAFAYHSDLDINARKSNQEQWMQQPGSIMVSTVAFGLYFSILGLICIIMHFQVSGLTNRMYGQ